MAKPWILVCIQWFNNVLFNLFFFFFYLIFIQCISLHFGLFNSGYRPGMDNKCSWIFRVDYFCMKLWKKKNNNYWINALNYDSHCANLIMVFMLQSYIIYVIQNIFFSLWNSSTAILIIRYYYPFSAQHLVMCTF